MPGRVGCLTLLVLLAPSRVPLPSSPTSEEEAYWWQDELRTVAFDLAASRDGHISRWPRLTVPAGSGTLPLPEVSVREGEDCWSRATTFPVGPVFLPWREGPVTLQVSAFRAGKQAFVRIDSPVDLSGARTLQPSGALLTVGGRPVRVGAGGDVDGGTVTTSGGGQSIELYLPLASESAPLELTVAAEVAGRYEETMPSGLAQVGLSRLAGQNSRSRRKSWVWLEPFRIRLVSSRARARLVWDGEEDGRPRLRSEWTTPGGETRKGGVTAKPCTAAGVATFRWQVEAQGGPFQLEGFQYRSPAETLVRDARLIAHRVEEQVGGAMRKPFWHDELAELEQAVKALATADRRDAFCRARRLRALLHKSLLDAPLLFVKRHPYFAGHIYDDYYTWRPGGGIHVLENPRDASDRHVVRAVIDAGTDSTLGEGVYRDPEVSWDAKRIVFAYKATNQGMTSIYEIGVDGENLRKLTESDSYHDITPCYLPDGGVVFTSTRPRGRVPCFNSGVDTLHTMRPDGSRIRSISANNVNEFDPAVLHDGRILYGRWEYVDKTALYMQSLWTMLPDGTGETALFANNMARPTAVLDARPVPGSSMIAAALTPHNGQAVGAIAMIDPVVEKNNLDAIINFTPEYPIEMDQGLQVGPSDPWPLSTEDVLFSNNALGGHGILELVDREGRRELVLCDADLSCYSPMLFEERPVPPVVASTREHEGKTGRFLVIDIHRGLTGAQRGDVKRLRIVEETARTSEVPPGGRWWNQAFLISWQGAYVVKNFLGTVPVHPDGSAYFEAPAGRALYLEALDADGREIQRMRTFVQAVPGVTRSCIGCHEEKTTTPRTAPAFPLALHGPPARPEEESWGSGFIDYPTMVQPVLDRHCVKCHGGEGGMAGGLDLSGGWTWAFNISHETLLKHNLVGFIRCHNSDVTSSDVLPPRTAGSGAAPLADLLVEGHEGRIPRLRPEERDLILAWMDGNSSYYGTWDYTPHATCNAILAAGKALAGEMKAAGCVSCHPSGHVGNDWINLQRPEWSRILRAPLAKAEGGLGLQWCRALKARPGLPLVTQRHMPPDVFRPPSWPERDPSGDAHVVFESEEDPRYLAMLEIIRRARGEALANARVDMPGARIVAGTCRLQVPMPLPDPPPPLEANVAPDGVVELSWPRNAGTIGLEFEVHRGDTEDFLPGQATLLVRTSGFHTSDERAPSGRQHYALVMCSDSLRSSPVRVSVQVPRLPPPGPPTGLRAIPSTGQITLVWNAVAGGASRYRVYRAREGTPGLDLLTDKPVVGAEYVDGTCEPEVQYVYVVRAVSRRGVESEAPTPVSAAALPEPQEPVFHAAFREDLRATLPGKKTIRGTPRGKASIEGGALSLGAGGYVTFVNRPEFHLRRRFSLECRVRFAEDGAMPVVVSCGQYQATGWFLQRFGSGYRWHLGGVNCDGGKLERGRWSHLVGTFDGHTARLYQNGKLVASVPCSPDLRPWKGELHVGQYGPGPAPSYQVTGSIDDLRIYHRVLSEREVQRKP